MDQKSGKKPVNVHSETEEAENEMKKKTSKTVKSIAAVGFAVGGISAVQNFEAYAADGDSIELTADNTDSGSQGEGKADGDNHETSGENNDNDSGKHDDVKDDSGDKSQDNHDEDHSGDDQKHGDDTKDQGSKGNQQDGSTHEAAVTTSNPSDSNEPVEAGNGTNDGAVSVAENGPTDNTSDNADTSGSTQEVTGPVTTVTTETSSEDTFNDDGTTTTTTTVTTTTEKSDGTVTSDTKTSTETKETTYVPADENEPIGPGYIEKYYKSDEYSSTEEKKPAENEINKTDYETYEQTGANGQFKTRTEEYYLADDGKTKVVIEDADKENIRQDGKYVITKYYKSEYDQNGKIVEKKISKEEYEQIKNENVVLKKEYFDKDGNSLKEEQFKSWTEEHSEAAQDTSVTENTTDDTNPVKEKKTTTYKEYTVSYFDEDGKEKTEKFGTEKDYKDFIENNDLRLKDDGTTDQYFYVKTKDGTTKHYVDSQNQDQDAKKYTVTVKTSDGTEETLPFDNYADYQKYMTDHQWKLDENSQKKVRHYYEVEKDGKITREYLSDDEEKEYADNKLNLGYGAYTEYTITYHVHNSEDPVTVTFTDKDSDEKKQEALSHYTQETDTHSAFYYFDKDGEKHVLTHEEYKKYQAEKEGNATDYHDAYQYSVTYTENDKVQTVLCKNSDEYRSLLKKYNITEDSGKTVHYYFEIDENGNIVKDKDGNPIKHELADQEASTDNTDSAEKKVLYTATYETKVNGSTDGEPEVITYTSYEAFKEDYDKHNVTKTTIYLDENRKELTLSSEDIEAYENGKLKNVVADVKHTATFWTWDGEKAVQKTISYKDSDEESVKTEAMRQIADGRLVDEKYDDNEAKRYYFDENGTKITLQESDVKDAEGKFVKTVYIIDGKVVNEDEYNTALHIEKGTDFSKIYFIDNGKDQEGNQLLIRVNGDQVPVSVEKADDGTAKFFVTDADNQKQEITEVSLKTKLSEKYNTANHTTNYYISGKNTNNEEVKVYFDDNNKIEEDKTVEGYVLSKDGQRTASIYTLKSDDGRYYLESADGTRIYVDNVSTYTSDTISMLNVLDPTSNINSKEATSTVENAALHFLTESSITSNFDIYADDFKANEHIDGNICVNTIDTDNNNQQKVSEIHASGRKDVNGLDKYSLILDPKGVKFGTVNNAAKIFSGQNISAENLNGVDILDEDGNHVKDENGQDLKDPSVIYKVDGNNKDEVAANIVNKVNELHGIADAERVAKEIDISGNLKRIAAAGESLLEASKNTASDWLETIKSILDVGDGGNQTRTLNENDVLLLNVTEADLNKTDSKMESFTYAFKKLISYIGIERNTRVIVNVSTDGKTKDDTIWVNNSLIDASNSLKDKYGKEDKSAEGSGNYNKTAGRIIWNFGDFEGKVSLNGGTAQGIYVVANGTLDLNDGALDGGIIAKNAIIRKEAHQSRVPKLPVTTVTKGYIVPDTKNQEGISTDAKILTKHQVFDDETTYHSIYKKVTETTKSATRTAWEGVSKALRSLYSDTKSEDTKKGKDIKEETTTLNVSTENRETYTASATYDEVKLVSEYGVVRSEVTVKDIHHEDYFITIDKKVFKPLLNKFHDVKVEKIPETPDTPDVPPENPETPPENPDTPHDDHDTPDTPNDDHDTPDTPKELHDKPDTPEVLGASRPKEQEVLGASRPKVLGVTRAAKTGDVMNMAKNGFAAAVGALVLAVWGGIKALFSRKHRK